MAGSDPWLGITWDATEAEKAEITAHFDSIAEWAERKNVRILLGEFGAYSKADMTSRVRWAEYVRSVTGSRGRIGNSGRDLEFTIRMTGCGAKNC